MILEMAENVKKYKKKKETRSIGREYFYKKYLSQKIRYPAIALRNHRNFKTNRQQPLPKNLYYKIINQYLDIYFFKFYFKGNSRYFFLSGTLHKFRDAYVLKIKQTRKFFTPIILYWLDKPVLSYALNIKLFKASNGYPLKKMHIAKLDKMFKQEGDIDSLLSKEEFEEQIFNKKQYFKHG